MKALILAVSLASSAAMAANWQLDSSASSLHFVSVKNDVVAEIHQFSELNGQWDGTTASISIPVSSMQTNIPIRNERIWQYVLQADKFAAIDVSVQISENVLKDMPISGAKLLDLPINLTIAGQTATVMANVQLVKLSDTLLQANTTAPLMLNTSSFNLTAGVAKLQELAGLKRIEPLVPVSFSVRFSR